MLSSMLLFHLLNDWTVSSHLQEFVLEPNQAKLGILGNEKRFVKIKMWQVSTSQLDQRLCVSSAHCWKKPLILKPSLYSHCFNSHCFQCRFWYATVANGLLFWLVRHVHIKGPSGTSLGTSGVNDAPESLLIISPITQQDWDVPLPELNRAETLHKLFLFYEFWNELPSH